MGRGAGLALVCGLVLALTMAAAAQGYQPCLGCAEHVELRTRWHRTFAMELEAESVLIAEHLAVEAEGRRYGLCESNVLLRSATAINGCHPFSLKRALLVATPIEILAFTSPAWGLGRAGHPNLALSLQLVPMLLHGWAIRHTLEAVHRRQRQIALLQ